MKVRLMKGTEEVHRDESFAKSKPLVLRVVDDEAYLQLEITDKEIRLTGDGGAHKRRAWEIELALPTGVGK